MNQTSAVLTQPNGRPIISDEDRGKGRPAGSRNIIPSDCLKGVYWVYKELGGQERMLSWCQEQPCNLYAFYTRILPKLLPRNVDYQLSDQDKGLIIRMFTGQAAPAEVVDQAAKTPVEPEISKTYGSPMPGTDKTPQKSTPEQIENNAPIQENQQAKNEIDAK